MKTTIENLVAMIPSLAAQLFLIGGALALAGAVLFALTFLWQRWASRSNDETERQASRRPAPYVGVTRPVRAKKGFAAIAEQLAETLRVDSDRVAELLARSSAFGSQDPSLAAA